MQDPARKRQYLELSEIDPARLLSGEAPRLIDEWQLAPKLWDAIRFEVDRRDEFGLFILTGSAVPPETSEISHSGIGRITKMLMRPMSLYESGDSSGQVSLSGLLAGNGDIRGESTMNIDKLSFLICRGGWPKAINEEEDVALQQAIDYFDAIVAVDISRVDNVERNKERDKENPPFVRAFRGHAGKNILHSCRYFRKRSGFHFGYDNNFVHKCVEKDICSGGFLLLESELAFKNGNTHLRYQIFYRSVRLYRRFGIGAERSCKRPKYDGLPVRKYVHTRFAYLRGGS